MEQLGEQVIRIVRGPERRAGASPASSEVVHASHTELLVLQPTPFCNIDCSYCYLPRRDDRSRMSIDTVRAAARRLREDGLLGTELTVVWHAGEPLVLPPAWYEEAFAAIAQELPASLQLQHSFQTNATLIDDGWCRFFQRHGVQLGISVDGPAHLHDARRRTRTGRGTHAAVMRGIARLRAHDVPFHAIAVVGADTLAEPDGFYDWFAEQGITELGCNFDEAEGAHATSSLAGHEAAHARFVERLLQRSMHGPVVVRELAAASQLLRAPLPRWQHRWPVNTQAMPLALITVGHDGRFGSFSPELLGQPSAAFDDFVLGNVHLEGYVDALRGERFARLWRGIERGIVACEATCSHFEFCGGGAPANKFYEHGDFGATETLHCRSMLQRPLAAVLAQAERALGWAA